MKKKSIILCIAQSLILFAPPKNKNRTFLNNKSQSTTIQNSIENEDIVKIESSDEEKSLNSSQHSFKAKDLPQEIKASSNFLLDAPVNSPQTDNVSLSKKDEESFDDLATLQDQTNRGAHFSEQIITTAHSCFRTAKKLGAQYGILSRIKYYNEIVTSQQAHADYIASTATSSNPHKGYNDLQDAILEAITSGTIENIKAALNLFENIHPYKSYLTQETLKKVSEAAKKYQEHLDFEQRSTTLAYLKATRLITFLKAESDKIDGASGFTVQNDKNLLTATEKTVEHLKSFASQNKSSQNENDDDFRSDDE